MKTHKKQVEELKKKVRGIEIKVAESRGRVEILNDNIRKLKEKYESCKKALAMIGGEK